jgi:cobalt-zinc-cadmium efflux system outer membrane protein
MGSVLPACAVYQAQPISAAANVRALDARTLHDRRLQEFIEASLSLSGEPVHAGLWDLSTLSLAALYFHPDLDIARAKLAGAEAGVITARERPNPALSLTNVFGQAAVVGAATPAGAAPITVGPVIDFVLETFGKRKYRTAQAEHLAESARWALATAGWQVRGRVRAALLDLWAARERLALTHRRLDLQDQLVGLLDRRFAVGEASSLDVSRERINRAQITFAIRDLERAAADARVQLATAIGIPVHALEGGDVSLSAFDQPPPTTGLDPPKGPFGYIDMGGMFTVLKVREHLRGYEDPGWYPHPPGTVADLASAEELRRDGIRSA